MVLIDLFLQAVNQLEQVVGMGINTGTGWDDDDEEEEEGSVDGWCFFFNSCGTMGRMITRCECGEGVSVCPPVMILIAFLPLDWVLEEVSEGGATVHRGSF